MLTHFSIVSLYIVLTTVVTKFLLSVYKYMSQVI